MGRVDVLIVNESAGLDKLLGEVLPETERVHLNIRRCKDTEALRGALEELSTAAAPGFVVKTAGGVKFLQVDDIVLSHMQGHQVVFCMVDGSQIFSTTMRVPFHSVVGPLLDNGFLQVRRGAIVNPKYMESFYGGELQLKSGEVITVPRRMRAGLMSGLMSVGRSGAHGK